MDIKVIEGGVVAAKGFKTAAVSANVKYTGRLDMALISSEQECKVAGVFTKNCVKAACVLWDSDIIESGENIHAIVVNSGIANACTGDEGYSNCEKTAEYVADSLGIKKEEVMVASTGVIGMQLPMDKIYKGIDELTSSLSSSKESGDASARAIMTTDTVSKQIAITYRIGNKDVIIGGMCKGSGMIHPNMGTMLAFITTDINISRDMLMKALREDVVDTYNMVSVDGDTSTNDSLIIMANGLADNDIIDVESQDFDNFKQALSYVNTYLAKLMAKDGEGATTLVEVVVGGARSKEDATILAKSVITSSLVKTAIYGNDANWGRIICALGYSGVEFDPNRVDLYYEGEKEKIAIYLHGKVAEYSEEVATAILKESAIKISINMNVGIYNATAWGCDLSHEYVSINGDYRS